ncbi:PREDICTED: pentatricopeptide [Prunus dulcis]|uniref:PREDICTED: pentatricopeptide n=1 Tax=Prunus dulcis TaxID=3755 RepID=A0A5E4FPW2_PRUDU|nr:PREDICTED: pentatricopeptide [Prunus dulcis]
MRDARGIFDEIQNPNGISWNITVRQYLEMGDGKKCNNDVFPDVCENACAIFDQPKSKNLIYETSIVLGYSMSGQTWKAKEFFNEMPELNVVTWNAMLAGYTHYFQWEEVLMVNTTKNIDQATLQLSLKVCASLSDVEMGKHVHGFIYRHGFYSFIFVRNGLLDMYGECGNLRGAKTDWFHQIRQHQDRVSWNALLCSYAHHGQSKLAMTIFVKCNWRKHLMSLCLQFS